MKGSLKCDYIAPTVFRGVYDENFGLASLIGKAIEMRVPPTKFHHFLSTLENFSGVLGTYGAALDNTFTLPAVKVVTKDGFEKVS